MKNTKAYIIIFHHTTILACNSKNDSDDMKFHIYKRGDAVGRDQNSEKR